VCLALACTIIANGHEQWPQLQGDALRSGNRPDLDLPTNLGLRGAVALNDAILAAPVVADQTIYVIDGSGCVFAIDARDCTIKWRVTTRGGLGNCNNVAAPVIVGKQLHVGTMAGFYYVLDRDNGRVLRELDCREPILSSPVSNGQRVYFATASGQVHAVDAQGVLQWRWDFVKEVIGFAGNRWSGKDWLEARPSRVTWRDHFVCSRDLCMVGDTIVIPVGGRTVLLEDVNPAGTNTDKAAPPKLRAIVEIPAFDGQEFPATLGQSADAAGNIYVQWHRRDNAGRVERIRLNPVDGQTKDEVQIDFVKGTQTAIQLAGLLSFSSVSVRDGAVYRVRPEQGFGLCRYEGPSDTPTVLAAAPAISPPVITREDLVYGGLDGNLYVVPQTGGPPTVLATAGRAPISAPIAIADRTICVGSEDGYLYVFGENGQAPIPDRDLRVHDLRSSLEGKFAHADFDWYTNYGNFSGTNSNVQGLEPPLRMRWMRRLEGTVKHLPVCGGGRMYIHTAEGQVIALEQDTGRLLWRKHWPDVYLSFTSPLFVRLPAADGLPGSASSERLLVPQAGIKQSRMRCLDAATGELMWEAPFTGSPSWSRQFPPVVHGRLAIYASGSGMYAAQGTEKPFVFKGAPAVDEQGREVMSWIYANDNPYYPRDHRPTLWAWDLESGKVVWEREFSDEGRGGNDCGLCLLNDKLYYSTFFGYSASQRARRGLPVENNGLTACLDPQNGEVIWKTNRFYVTAKCTLSARDGRLYIGGNNQPNEQSTDRHVWCLNASDGSLVWKSDPLTSALNVVTVGEKFIFSNALRGRGNVFDRETGRIIDGVMHNYACCRFTMSEPYILGANMDMIHLGEGCRLVSTGPAIDSRECLGAVVSNGRVFYISQASGFVVSQTYGAQTLPAVWEQRF
jgi:outer membrane protein assembly factor BamB